MADNLTKVNCRNNKFSQVTYRTTYLDLTKHLICKRNDIYYCYTCTTKLGCLSNVLQHIKNDPTHEKLFKINERNIQTYYSDISVDKCEEMVLNGIVPTYNSSFFCTICIKSISHLEQISKHIDDLHIKKKNSQPTQPNSNAADNKTTTKTKSENTISNSIENISRNNNINKSKRLTIENINSIMQKENIKIAIKKNGIEMHCCLCKLTLYNAQIALRHINGSVHKKKKTLFDSGELCNISKINNLFTYEKVYDKNTVKIDSDKAESTDSDDDLSFKSCNSTISLDNYSDIQCLDSNQMDSIVNVNLRIINTASGSTIHSTCNIKTLNLQTVYNNINGSSHKDRCKNTINSMENKNSIKRNEPNKLASKDNSSGCVKRVLNNNKIYYNSKKSAKQKSINSQEVSSKSTKSNINKINNLFTYEKVHDKNTVKIYSDKTESTDSDDDLSFKSCNSIISLDNYSDIQCLDSNQMDSILNNIVDFKVDKNSLSKKNRKGINKFLSNSKPTLTKHFTNLRNFGETYILMCIEQSNTNIFEIESEKLQKLQLGLSLTFSDGEIRLCMPCGEGILNDLFFIYDHLLSKKHIESVEKMEEYHKDFENFQDQFSDLQLAKSYMVDFSDDLVKCCACETDVQNDDFILKDHIKSSTHSETTQILKKSEEDMFKKIRSYLAETWYYAERFFCEVCKSKFDSEIFFAEHLASKSHLDKQRLSISNGSRLHFSLCIVCATYWYGKSCSYSKHSDGNFHQYFLKNRSLISYNLTDLVKNILNSYDSTIESLVQQSNNIDKSIETNLIESIEKIVRTIYPKAESYLFGSRACFLASCDSDLDIYIDCEQNYFNVLTSATINKYISKIQEQFLKHEDTWIVEEVVLKARIPIIKLRHRSSYLYCDISCSNGLSVDKTSMLRHFIKAYPNVQKLIVFLKKWLVLNRLSGGEGITSFAISNLVIFYLQTEKILPSVHISQETCSSFVAGWEITKTRNIVAEKTNKTVKELLVGFFSYYAKFNYMTDVICPYLGKPIKKRLFSNFDDLPIEMESYKRLYNKNIAGYFRFDSPVCLQDPVELSENTTKAVTKFQLRSFKQNCHESVDILLKVNENKDDK